MKIPSLFFEDRLQKSEGISDKCWGYYTYITNILLLYPFKYNRVILTCYKYVIKIISERLNLSADLYRAVLPLLDSLIYSLWLMVIGCCWYLLGTRLFALGLWLFVMSPLGFSGLGFLFFFWYFYYSFFAFLFGVLYGLGGSFTFSVPVGEDVLSLFYYLSISYDWGGSSI